MNVIQNGCSPLPASPQGEDRNGKAPQRSGLPWIRSTQYLGITHLSLPACAAAQLPTCPSQPQGCHESCHCFWRETNHVERNQKKGSSEEDRLIIVPGLCRGLRARAPICFPTTYCLAHKTGDLSMASLPVFIYLFMQHLCPGALY